MHIHVSTVKKAVLRHFEPLILSQDRQLHTSGLHLQAGLIQASVFDKIGKGLIAVGLRAPMIMSLGQPEHLSYVERRPSDRGVEAAPQHCADLDPWIQEGGCGHFHQLAQ